MIDATKRWLRRNRTTFAVGAGVIGVGYIAGQYVISKIGETRERMISERVAKEKYELSKVHWVTSRLNLIDVVYDDAFSRIKKIALSQYCKRTVNARININSNIVCHRWGRLLLPKASDCSHQLEGVPEVF